MEGDSDHEARPGGVSNRNSGGCVDGGRGEGYAPLAWAWGGRHYDRSPRPTEPGVRRRGLRACADRLATFHYLSVLRTIKWAPHHSLIHSLPAYPRSL